MLVAATVAVPADTRPRARGWIHLIAFLLSPVLAGTMIALAAAQSGRAALGASIYCTSMAAAFGTSALYHRHRWTERGWQLMRRLDHAMIFLFIGGTYTPFALLALSGSTRWWMLGMVWGACLVGIGVKVARPHGARWLAVPLYVGVGWAAMFAIGDILTNAGMAALVLLLCGGVLYSIGGVFYAAHWPNPAPRVFGYHEVFHLLTVVAAACQYIAVFFLIYRSPLV